MSDDIYQKAGGRFMLFLMVSAFIWMFFAARTSSEPAPLYASPDIAQLGNSGRLQFVNGYANW